MSRIHAVLNPAALKAAIDTGGGSALAGLRHFAADMASPPRIPSMVEPDAFKVGLDLAVTPGAVVSRTEVSELIQYRPATAAVRQVPLLIVPPTINKFYVIDLAPGRSLAEYLVGRGFQVFMMSWRNPDSRHAKWDFNTYGQAVLDAMDAVARITGSEQTAITGVCSGGVIQPAGRGQAVRAVDQRAHRRDGEPARQRQGQVSGGQGLPGRPGGMAAARGELPRVLVAVLQAMWAQSMEFSELNVEYGYRYQSAAVVPISSRRGGSC
ncbi:MAG TPA: hypothetical protein VF933_03570 [Streptosporangiaceae bacterium]